MIIFQRLLRDSEITAHTADCPVAAAAECQLRKDCMQFSSTQKYLHTAEGTKMLYNFVRNVCGCAGDWKMDAFVENSITELSVRRLETEKYCCALSGGVDSSVAAGTACPKAIGKQLTCVFVDHGLLRKNEGDEVEAVFGPDGQFDLNFIRVNAQERYYNKLAGVDRTGEQNVRLSVKNLSVSSKKKQRRSVLLNSLHREPFIRMW